MDENSSSETRGKPIRCRAAVTRKPAEPLVIEEIMLAPPMAREDFPGIFPRILGQEAIGVVESVGEDVDEVTDGDTIYHPFIRLRLWRMCRLQIRKEQLMFKTPFQNISLHGCQDISPADSLTSKGRLLIIFQMSQAIAHVTKIDPSVPPNPACLLSCGISTGVGAAWRTANVETGSTVAIFGLGSVGLAVAEGARLGGASIIIGVDVNPNKFEMGLGKNYCVRSGQAGLTSHVVSFSTSDFLQSGKRLMDPCLEGSKLNVIFPFSLNATWTRSCRWVNLLLMR